ATLEASGLAVGLPEGQMGNSEVGHMNLGAGRVVYQEITRIDKAIEEGDFFGNEEFKSACGFAKGRGSRLHLMGLFSDGGVHSHLRHLFALLEMAEQEGLAPDQVVVHAFTDGRDTDPQAGVAYVRQFQAEAERIGVGRIGTVVGRYYAMDRDNRWPRTAAAYGLLTAAFDGEPVPTEFDDPVDALEASYADGVTDEFVKPVRIAGTPPVADGDAVVFFNFRADRARQLTRAFTDPAFDHFDRGTPENRPLELHYVTFTPYDAEFELPVAFPKVNLTDTLGEVVSRAGLTQLRAAETEKYPHVTYFFSGGREDPFEAERRILVPSPKVPTYDLQPEMSAPELAERVAEAIRTEPPDLVILNFANPDMVGHTGVFEAAVKAIEAVDAAAKVVVEAARGNGYTVEIIADHGNADKMRNPDGSPHTAHTTALVPHLILRDGFDGPIRPGKLGDIAPTILTLMGLDVPEAMTGDVLVEVEQEAA
ncbi:MAG: 2,3-bisphosphoglycerate-independent phosphoglycerate mutase, partial [Rhodothermales bacterium]|nr:2,3-bisphosphoglycerate-independent phosphoglycerate mutase [Rhodothermales bacterium]